MILDFNTLPIETFARFKEGEGEMSAQMFFDGTNRIFRGILTPGSSIGEHRHEENSEVLFVLKGEGTLVEDGNASIISAGQCTYCPKGHCHSLKNTGEVDLEFYAVVTNQ